MTEQPELFVPERYIVNRDFRAVHNGVTIQYLAGQVIEDQARVEALLAASSPIALIRDDEDLGTCPHCGRSFSLSAQQGARELLRRAQQIMPGHR